MKKVSYRATCYRFPGTSGTPSSDEPRKLEETILTRYDSRKEIVAFLFERAAKFFHDFGGVATSDIPDALTIEIKSLEVVPMPKPTWAAPKDKHAA